MNKSRLITILDYIRKHPNSYDQLTLRLMPHWRSLISDCGTRYCIAGYAELFFANVDNIVTRNRWHRAKQLLDLNEAEASYLFNGDRELSEIMERIYLGGKNYGKQPHEYENEITRLEEIIKILRHVI